MTDTFFLLKPKLINHFLLDKDTDIMCLASRSIFILITNFNLFAESISSNSLRYTINGLLIIKLAIIARKLWAEFINTKSGFNLYTIKISLKKLVNLIIKSIFLLLYILFNVYTLSIYFSNSFLSGPFTIPIRNNL